MKEINVFVSVGGTANDMQEAFVRAVEDRLRGEGLIPHTVGRNTFSADAPLKTVTELMDTCAGTVVIALERTYFPSGVEKRGGACAASLAEVRYPTPWNQIEAAMAFSRGHPLMVIVERGLRSEGLLERGNQWYVQSVEPIPSSMTSLEFNGVLASWKERVAQNAITKGENSSENVKSPDQLTIGDLMRGLKPAQLWSMLAALAALVAASVAVGAKLFNPILK
jgi:hypothetical protein